MKDEIEEEEFRGGVDPEEFAENWSKVNPEQLKKWGDSYYSPEAQLERKRLGFPTSQIIIQTPQQGVMESARWVDSGPDLITKDIYDSALESVGKQVSKWIVEGQHEEIEALAKAVKATNRNTDDERTTARKEILEVYHTFRRAGIQLPSNTQIKERMRFWERVKRADSYYEKGKFLTDLRAVGLGGLITTSRGRS